MTGTGIVQRLLLAVLALVLTGCDRAGGIVLDDRHWACTRQEPISLYPYMTQCVEYRMMR